MRVMHIPFLFKQNGDLGDLPQEHWTITRDVQLVSILYTLPLASVGLTDCISDAISVFIMLTYFDH